MSPSPVPDGYVRGPIFYDGGAEDSVYNEYARYVFWNLAGGYGARIIVLTTNRGATEADYGYTAAFQALEAASVRLMVVGDRSAGFDTAVIHQIEHSTAVFLSGGHPLRWSTTIGGTPLATAIRRANACGKAVGGVGGSAAFLGNHMLVYDDQTLPRMAPGLGLSNRILVAAHFDAGKYCHLLQMAIASNPYVLGVGLSDQAAFIRRADTMIEVVGLASLYLVDGQQMTTTNLQTWRPGQDFIADGMRTLELQPDFRYDLETHSVQPPELAMPMPNRSSL